MCDRGVLSKSSFVDSRILSQAPNDAPRELSAGFQPGPRDVICSRGADCFNNPGNKFFRSKLSEHLQEYSQAPNKMKKGIIVSNIIDEIREGGGAFVRQDTSTGIWFEVGDRLAREKTGQALRSALRKSSPTSLPSAKSAMRKSDSPMSSTSTGSGGTRQAAVATGRNVFGDELAPSGRNLRTAASAISSHIPTTLAVLSSSRTRRGDGLTKANSSRTWSGGDAPRESGATAVPLTALRRSLTNPSQLDADDMSFVLPPTFLEERESSVFGAPLPPLPPPPGGGDVNLQRQVSTWSSVIARLPGLLDYDPYPSVSAAATVREPAALMRRESLDGRGVHGHASFGGPRRSFGGVPLEIRLDATDPHPSRRAGLMRSTSLSDDGDDDIDLGEWDI